MLPFRYTSVSPSTTPSLWSPSWPATRTCLEAFLVGDDPIVALVRPGNQGWSAGMTTLGAVLAAVLDAAVLAAVLGLAGISWVNARHASGELRERYRWRAQILAGLASTWVLTLAGLSTGADHLTCKSPFACHGS